MHRRFLCVTFAALLGSLSSGLRTQAEPGDAIDGQRSSEMVEKAIQYLRKSRAADGSFRAHAGPGVTALVTTAILRHGRSPNDPLVAKSLEYLETFIHDDGGIYQPGTFYKNYETCLAVLCFTEANGDGRYGDVLRKAEAFLKELQWDEGEGKTESDFAYGGQGYGRSQHADLSNTSFFIEALKATGNDADSAAMQKALLFVSRCQNLETEHNTTPFSAKNPDGGFYYTADGGGNSPAGVTETGGLRSFGSMTYAGLRSMLYAGVGPEDPRVAAATTWIRKHYGLESNPGMGEASLYYYYQTFAKALDALGQDSFVDAEGIEHDWRSELVAALADRQRPDGSWVNQNTQFLEGEADLVTSYALLALSHCDSDRAPGKAPQPGGPLGAEGEAQ